MEEDEPEGLGKRMFELDELFEPEPLGKRIVEWGKVAAAIIVVSVVGIVGGIAAVSLAGVIFVALFGDPLEVMGPYADGIGTAGIRDWIGMWGYGIGVFVVAGSGYLALDTLFSLEFSRESRADLKRRASESSEMLGEIRAECDQLNDELVRTVERLETITETNEGLVEENARLVEERDALVLGLSQRTDSPLDTED